MHTWVHISLHCNTSAAERGWYTRVLLRAYQWSQEELLGGRMHDKRCGCLSKQVADVKRRTAEFDTSLHSGQQQRGGSQGGRRAADSQDPQWYPVQIFTLSDKPRNTQFRGRADQIRRWHNGVRLDCNLYNNTESVNQRNLILFQNILFEVLINIKMCLMESIGMDGQRKMFFIKSKNDLAASNKRWSIFLHSTK